MRYDHPQDLFDPTYLDSEENREGEDAEYEDGLVIRTIDDLLEEV